MHSSTVETTGLRPQHDRVVEIACVSTLGGRRLDTFETLVDLGCRIPPATSASHDTRFSAESELRSRFRQLASGKA